MSALNNDNVANVVSEAIAARIPAGWFAENVRPWLWAAYCALAILTYREVLRFLILARQLGC
ncbi:MAG: hypothetical protein ACYDDI_11710 [Candidatus Acidiferrales bacterium]